MAFIVYTFVDISHVDYRYFIWIFFFGMANSMLNPIIYGACLFCRHKKHEQRYVRLTLESYRYVIAIVSSAVDRAVRLRKATRR